MYLHGGITRRTLLPLPARRYGMERLWCSRPCTSRMRPLRRPPRHPPCVCCLPATSTTRLPSHSAATPPPHPPTCPHLTLPPPPTPTLFDAHAARLGVPQVSVILADREQSLRSWKLAGAMMNLVLLKPEQRRAEGEQSTRSPQPQEASSAGAPAVASSVMRKSIHATHGDV